MTLHLTLPPTPNILTLQLFTVPGMKSDLEFVRHNEEQLSIAIGLESESKRVCSPSAAVAKQLMVISFIAVALARLLSLLCFLTSVGEYLWYR